MSWIVYLLIFVALLLGIGFASQYFGAGKGLAEFGAGLGGLGAGIGAFGRGVGSAVGGFISEAFSPKITPTFLPTIGFRFCLEPVISCSSPSGVSGGYNLQQGTYESTFKTDSSVVPKFISEREVIPQVPEKPIMLYAPPSTTLSNVINETVSRMSGGGATVRPIRLFT